MSSEGFPANKKSYMKEINIGIAHVITYVVDQSQVLHSLTAGIKCI